MGFVARLLNNQKQLSTSKMMRIAKCCCCSVRTACYVFGILGILGGIINLYTCGTTLNFFDPAKLYNRNPSPELIEFVQACAKAGYNAIEILEIMDKARSLAKFGIFWNICFIVTNALMIFGVKEEKEKFLLPTIFWIPISALGTLILLILVAVMIPGEAVFATIIAGILVLTCNFFIWLSVYSHRQEIKEKNGGANGMQMA